MATRSRKGDCKLLGLKVRSYSVVTEGDHVLAKALMKTAEESVFRYASSPVWSIWKWVTDLLRFYKTTSKYLGRLGQFVKERKDTLIYVVSGVIAWKSFYFTFHFSRRLLKSLYKPLKTPQKPSVNWKVCYEATPERL